MNWLEFIININIGIINLFLLLNIIHKDWFFCENRYSIEFINNEYSNKYIIRKPLLTLNVSTF